uniref:C2H2-type domain-containing protein n=1 Tax=Panagrellus redivivus TaxID=6233 RepID=A0A7E4UL84_PANRE
MQSNRKKSGVRDFFNAEGFCLICNKQLCLVKSCNLRRHLLTKHPGQYSEVGNNSLPPPTKTETPDIAPVIRTVSEDDRAFAAFAATSGFTVQDLTNGHLRQLLAKIPNFEIPTEDSLRYVQDLEIFESETKIKSLLSANKGKISIITDVTKTKSAQLHFLVVAASVYNAQSDEIKVMALDVVHFDQPPNQQQCIFDEIQRILERFDVSMFDICNFVTDGASSLVATFKHNVPDSNASTAPVSNDTLDNSTANLLQNIFGDLPDTVTPVDGNDISVDKTDSLFYSRGAYLFQLLPNRKRCVAFQLHLAMQNAFDHDHLINSAKIHACNFIDNLIKTTQCPSTPKINKVVSTPRSSKWAFTVALFQRIIHAKDELANTAARLGWQFFNADDLETMNSVVFVADLVKTFVTKLQSEATVTLSLIYPGLLHLIQTISDSTCPEYMKTSIITSLRQQFATILDKNNPNFDPIYLLAAFLDPLTSRFLDEDKTEIIKYVKFVRPSPEQNNDVSIVIEEPNPFGFGQTVKKRKVVVNKSADDISREASSFFDEMNSVIGKSQDNFWSSYKSVYPQLYDLVTVVFGQPATGVFAEKMISLVNQNAIQNNFHYVPLDVRRNVLLSLN